MDLTTTLSLMAAAFAAFGLATWRARRGHPPGKPPLIPYGVIQFAALLAVLLLAGHVISLVTGEPYRGRFGALPPLTRG